MREVWNESSDRLEAWLDEANTHPDLSHCLMAALQAASPVSHFVDNGANSVRDPAHEQDVIGWHNLLEGCISKLWHDKQCKHCMRQHSARSADCWAQGLVSNLLEISHSMWTKHNEMLHEKHANGLLLAKAAKSEAWT